MENLHTIFPKNLLERLDRFVDIAFFIGDYHKGKSLYVSKGMQNILGYDPKLFDMGGADFLFSLVHPEDIPMLLSKQAASTQLSSLRDSKKNHAHLMDVEYRVKHAAGRWIWISFKGYLLDYA